MLRKEKVIEIISNMPDQFSIEDLADRLILLQKIEQGLAQSDAGHVMSTAEARKRFFGKSV